MTENDYMTVPDAAKKIGVTREWMRRLAARGIKGDAHGIPAIRIGRDYLIRRKDVENFQHQPTGWKKGKKRGTRNKK